MRRFWLLAAVAGLTAACNSDVQNTIAWPTRVVRGQTVSMAVDSNFMAPGKDQWDLSLENVTVRLDWGGAGGPVTLSKVDGLQVIEAWAHPGVALNTSFPWPTNSRGWVAVVVFTVPEDPIVPTAELPATATVTLLKDGVEIPTGFGADIGSQIEIVAGGSPPTLVPYPFELEPPPLLRVVGKAGTGKFDDPGWTNPSIGSIQFEIEHPAGLTLPDAYPIADAAGATVVVGPGNGVNRRKVVLVDPDGFTLEEDAANRPGIAGDGPFLDIAVAGGPFEEADFTVYDLVVTDVDGNALIDHAGASSEFFGFYIRGPRP